MAKLKNKVWDFFMSNYDLYILLSRICVLGAALVAMIAIVAVLIQPSNSEGISALGGRADTFYNKSKGKTLATKMKVVTYVCLVLAALLMIGFYVVDLILVK